MSALLGRGAVIVWNDVDAEGRSQFYEWHDKEHIPERLSIPGFRRGRRYIRTSQSNHGPAWLTLYEADDVNVLTSPGYLARLNAPTPLTQSTLKFFRNTARAVCTIVHSVGSSSGGHMLALRVDVPPETTDAFVDRLSRIVFPRAMALTGVLACHLFGADQTASFIDTAESKTRTFDVPSWVVLVEASSREAALAAGSCLDDESLDVTGVVVRPDGGVYGLEICRLGSSLT